MTDAETIATVFEHRGVQYFSVESDTDNPDEWVAMDSPVEVRQ